MERLLQALDELDDLVAMLRQLWMAYGAPLSQNPPRPRRALRELSMTSHCVDAAAVGGG